MIACTPDQLLPCLMSSDVDRIRGLFLHVSAHVYPSFVDGWFRTAPGTRRPVRARVRVEPSPRAVRGMLVRHEGVLSEQFYGLGLGLGAGQPRRRSRMSSYRNRGAVTGASKPLWSRILAFPDRLRLPSGPAAARRASGSGEWAPPAGEIAGDIVEIAGDIVEIAGDIVEIVVRREAWRGW